MSKPLKFSRAVFELGESLLSADHCLIGEHVDYLVGNNDKRWLALENKAFNHLIELELLVEKADILAGKAKNERKRPKHS